MVEAFQELAFKAECFAVFRIVVKKKVINHYVVHYMTSKRQAKASLTRVMLDRIRHIKRVDIWNFKNFNMDFILTKLTKDTDKFRKYITEFHAEMEELNRNLEKVLPADKMKLQLKDDQKALARIRHLVSQVKDVENDINWLIIDPAEAMKSGKALKVDRYFASPN